MVEEKTVCKDTFTNVFSYQVILLFLQDTYVTLIDKTDPRAPTKHKDYWIHTLKTKAPMGINVEGGYWVSVFHKYCTTISFPGFRRLVLGLFPVYSDYGYIYFISSFSTIVVVFTFEMEAFMAMVSVVNLVTIALYSSFSGVRNLLLIIIIIVDCYCYYLIQSALPAL